VYHGLQSASAAELIADAGGQGVRGRCLGLLRMMIVCRIVERVPPAARPRMRGLVALRMWEFHDLLMQAESRFGRSLRGIGGDHRS